MSMCFKSDVLMSDELAAIPIQMTNVGLVVTRLDKTEEEMDGAYISPGAHPIIMIAGQGIDLETPVDKMVASNDSVELGLLNMDMAVLDPRIIIVELAKIS
ncbi:hypothetical protein V6N13_148086 [Hibiscus sabdariffa]